MRILFCWLLLLACIAVGSLVLWHGGWSKVIVIPKAHVSRYAPSDYDKPLKPLATKDDVLDSTWAVSNANYFGMPPDGYGVHGDGKGRFAPSFNGLIVTNGDMIRTNLIQAIVASWRLYELRSAPPRP